MRRRILPVIVSLVLAVGFLGAAPSGASASCSQAKVILWEHVQYNGRGLEVCYGTNIPNLGVYNFDNITSSARFYEFTVQTSVCLYSDVNYIGQFWRTDVGGQGQQWYALFNDWASSVKFGCG